MQKEQQFITDHAIHLINMYCTLPGYPMKIVLLAPWATGACALCIKQ